MFAQCITAMAHHRYLELEGGHKLVEFIVKQCALSDEEVGVFLFISKIQFSKSSSVFYLRHGVKQFSI